MQGYILNYNRVKDEDLIVTVLTKESINTLYRFYGARHSIINIGYKIDFEVEESAKVTIGRLKDVIQLGNDWLFDRNKLYHWQQFIKLLYTHLRDVVEIDEFYFELLEYLSARLSLQSPKRAIIEAYVKLLKYEGRLFDTIECMICDQTIEEEEVVIIRAFQQTHIDCLHKTKFNKAKIAELFSTYNSFHLNDEEISELWLILLEGL